MQKKKKKKKKKKKLTRIEHALLGLLAFCERETKSSHKFKQIGGNNR
jgi:hypothetical protein